MDVLSVGITPWDLNRDHSAAWLIEQAVYAESLGFDSFFLPESHFVGRASLPEPLMLLAAVAGATARIRLGTTSLLLPVRHPLQTAEQVAVLDQLCQGRVILGLGRGYQPALYQAFDVPLKDKRRIFEACLALMRQAWRGDPVCTSNDGEPVVLSPLPLQRPHPPLWVAAFGPKALNQAGRLGLPYLASPMEPLAVLVENYQRIAQASADAGVVPSPVIPIMRTVFVAEQPELISNVRTLLLNQTQAANLRRPVSTDIDEWALVGTPSHVLEQIGRYRTLTGMTHLVATRLRVSGIDDGHLRNSLRLLAELRRDL